MIKKNTAITGFSFIIANKNGVQQTTGTVTGYYAHAGVYQGTITNSPSYDSSLNAWEVNLTASEMNADLVNLTFIHSGSGLDIHFQIHTEAKTIDDLNDLSAADVNAEVDTALGDYDGPTKAEMDSGFAGLNDLSAAEVNAEVDTALADYDPPTKAELDTAETNIIAEVDANESKIDTIDTVVDSIQSDVTTIDGKVDTIDTVVDGIQTDLDNGTDGLGAIKDAIDANQVDLTNIDGKIDTVDTVVDGIQSDLDNGTDGLGAIKTAVDANQTDLTNIEGKVDTVDNVVDSIEGKVDTIDSNVDDVFALVESLSNGSGASLISASSGDNTSSAIKGVSFTGVETSGDYTATIVADGTYHNITHSGNVIDIVYEFNIGEGRQAAEILFKGYLNSGNDDILIQAYNYTTTSWDTRGIRNGQGGSSNKTNVAYLLSNHTGMGAEAGDVLVRLISTGGTSPDLFVDELLISAISVSQSAGYAEGAIWVDSAGDSGTTPYINGTADNPCPWADAQTLSTNLGINKFHIAPAQSITLTTGLSGKIFAGNAWYLDMNNQTVNACYFECACIKGVCSGSTQISGFVKCNFGDGAQATTIPLGIYHDCGFNGNVTYPITIAYNGEYVFNNGFSQVPGSATPYFNASTISSSTGLNFRRWSGGSNMTLNSNCTMSLEVVTGGGQTITTGGADVEIRGVYREANITLSASETVQLVGVSGSVTISGSATAATVNIYGVCNNITDTSTGSTVNINTVEDKVNDVKQLTDDTLAITLSK